MSATSDRPFRWRRVVVLSLIGFLVPVGLIAAGLRSGWPFVGLSAVITFLFIADHSWEKSTREKGFTKIGLLALLVAFWSMPVFVFAGWSPLGSFFLMGVGLLASMGDRVRVFGWRDGLRLPPRDAPPRSKRLAVASELLLLVSVGFLMVGIILNDQLDLVAIPLVATSLVTGRYGRRGWEKPQSRVQHPVVRRRRMPEEARWRYLYANVCLVAGVAAFFAVPYSGLGITALSIILLLTGAYLHLASWQIRRDARRGQQPSHHRDSPV